jgi:hypothetical protein
MRGKRSSFLIIGAVVALSACGGSDVTVQVLGEGADGQIPQSNLEIFFYPFDRDSVFDALDTEAASPKPEIPEVMLATFAQIRALQEEWRDKEAEWSESRDRMQTLSEEMQAMDPRSRGTREYMSKYEEFEQLEGVEGRLNREKQALFEQFTAMQDSVTTQVDEFKAVRNTWEDDAYAGYFDIEQSIVTQQGRQVFADTTSANGFVTRALPAGDWWINARIRVPVGEFVWNLKIDPAQVDTVRLDVSNGDERLRL